MDRLRDQSGDATRWPALTEQERGILELIGEGLTNRQIGERLFLAEKTVKNYVSLAVRQARHGAPDAGGGLRGQGLRGNRPLNQPGRNHRPGPQRPTPVPRTGSRSVLPPSSGAGDSSFAAEFPAGPVGRG